MAAINIADSSRTEEFSWKRSVFFN